MRSELLALIAAVGVAGTACAGVLSEPIFTTVTPLSSNAELGRRMLSPLTAAQMQETLAQRHATLRAQPLDPAKERFVLYVPDRQPPSGYGLIVFIPPWQDARLPERWAPVLDERGLIFVSMAGAGNPEDVYARRAPLALLAEANVAARYRLDPERIYVAGFSGGAHVALHVALAYPDVFRGAFLNAGSDPVGTLSDPLPPRELFERLQSSRFIFVTGENDEQNLTSDAASIRSLKNWCVFNVAGFASPHAGHAVADQNALSRALDRLEGFQRAEPEEAAGCRAEVDRTIDAKLGQVTSLITAGKQDRARKILTELDSRFGGLAGGKIANLAAQLTPP